jgi:hypothetical protein
MNSIRRRSFLELGCFAFAAVAAAGANGGDAKKKRGGGMYPETQRPIADVLIEKYLKPTPVTLDVGAAKPFTALHFSDTHVSQCDAQDFIDGDERAMILYNARYPRFPVSVQSLAAVCAYGRKHNRLLLNTGDIFDFRSEANIRCVERAFKGMDVFSALGNHEGYGHHSREMNPRSKAERDALRTRYEKALGNPLLVASRVVNGVNFVAFDNGGMERDRLTEQLAAVRAEFSRAMPVVLMCHMPLYTPQLLEDMCEKRNRKRPEGSLRSYVMLGEEACGTKPLAAVRDFMAFLRNQANLKAILCGHLHFEWRGTFNGNVPMLVAGGNFEGHAYEISFK